MQNFLSYSAKVCTKLQERISVAWPAVLLPSGFGNQSSCSAEESGKSRKSSPKSPISMHLLSNIIAHTTSFTASCMSFPRRDVARAYNLHFRTPKHHSTALRIFACAALNLHSWSSVKPRNGGISHSKQGYPESPERRVNKHKIKMKIEHLTF